MNTQPKYPESWPEGVELPISSNWAWTYNCGVYSMCGIGESGCVIDYQDPDTYPMFIMGIGSYEHFITDGEYIWHIGKLDSGEACLDSYRLNHIPTQQQVHTAINEYINE
jgi:hypothetical protein